jgi:restriction system protein
METHLATMFTISEEEKLQMYVSGNGPIFVDRIQWALCYLNMAVLVQKSKRGIREYRVEKESPNLSKTHP